MSNPFEHPYTPPAKDAKGAVPEIPAPPAYYPPSDSFQQAPQYGYGESTPVHPYQQPQPYPAYSQPENVEGKRHAKLSLIFGIIGLLILGIVFGPLAIIQAKKAEDLGTPATAGKVLGWIAVSFAVIYLVFTLPGLLAG